MCAPLNHMYMQVYANVHVYACVYAYNERESAVCMLMCVCVSSHTYRAYQVPKTYDAKMKEETCTKKALTVHIET